MNKAVESYKAFVENLDKRIFYLLGPLAFVSLIGFFFIYGLLWLKIFDNDYPYANCSSCVFFAIVVGFGMAFVTVCCLCTIVVLFGLLKCLWDCLLNTKQGSIDDL